MITTRPQLGLGIGWRPELALAIERRVHTSNDLGFVELTAENISLTNLPPAIMHLRDCGLQIIPHGISLSLGSAQPPDRRRLDHLARLADRLHAPLVSEHIAFVRAGDLEAGHLLPVARMRQQLEILIENVNAARKVLPVPLALENIAALFTWPENSLDETAFLTELLERTDSLLLLDLANLHANAKNLGTSAELFLQHAPLHRLAYVHTAGGVTRECIYHDSHAHPVPPEVLALLTQLTARCDRHSFPGSMLERDENFPTEDQLNAELDALAAASSLPPAAANFSEASHA